MIRSPRILPVCRVHARHRILTLALPCCILVFAILLLFVFVIPIDAQQAATSYRIAGVVVDAITGSPVARARMSIFADGDEADTIADDSGRFVFDGVEPGKKYNLNADAVGYVRESLDQHWNFSTAVAVGSGLDTEHIIFRLHPQAVIYGVITDELGEAVRNAQVMLFSTESAGGTRAPVIHGQASANDLGEFRFAHLLPGKYYVVVQAQPWYARHGFDYSGTPKPNPMLDLVYPITFYPGVTDEHSAVELNMSAGDKREADVQLVAVPALHLRLNDIPDDVTTVGIGAHQKIFGSWEMGGIPAMQGEIGPGQYEIAGVPPGNLTLNIATGASQGSMRSVQGNFANGDTIDAASALGSGNISGRVIFPAGTESLRGQIALVGGTSGPNYSAEIKKDGSFSFEPVQPGTYTVNVFTNSRNGNYVEKISATGANASGRELTIENSADVQLDVTVGRGVSRISGLATLEGKPLAGALVLLSPASGQNLEEDWRMDQSDSDGTFELGLIIPGKYILLAIEDAWDVEWKNQTALKPYLAKARTIEIQPNDARKITIEVQRKSVGTGSNAHP